MKFSLLDNVESQDEYAPKTSDGYIYYIRLKINSHVYYKLGFTKKSSIYERFSFNGCEDYKHIDRVLFFHHFENAYELEQDIHSFLKRERLHSRLDKYFPFFNNGQSEIYFNDYLLLEDHYDEKRKEKNLSFINRWVETLPPHSENWHERPLDDLDGYPILSRLARIHDFFCGDWLIEKRKKILRLMPDYYEARVRFYAARAALLNTSYRLRDVSINDERWLPYQTDRDVRDKQYALENKAQQPPLTGSESWHEKLWRWEARVSPNKQIFPRDKQQLLAMTSLDLRMGDSTPDILPAEIGNLTNLRVLTIFGPILHIPSEIGNLGNLTELRLWWGNFHTLPDTIVNLKKLKLLDLVAGELRFLPTQLGKLSNLRYLGLSCNSLTVLPESIGDLINLEELMLDGNSDDCNHPLGWNPITSFPSTFSKLKSLKKLSIEEDHGGYDKVSVSSPIPREILDCRNLEVIKSRYWIDGYLKDLKKLKKLKTLKAAMKPDDKEMRRYAKKLRRIESVHIYSNGMGLPDERNRYTNNRITDIFVEKRKITERR